jgi:ABC-type branched-subunit amino acid transport system substrate-binding protein
MAGGEAPQGAVEEAGMNRGHQAETSAARFGRVRLGVLLAGVLALLAACSGTSDFFNAQPSGPAQPATAIGTGQIKVGLILPLSAGGNAGVAALSMKNAAEMALVEFSSPNIQLLVKDDGGSASGAAQAAQQALAEGAEIIIGPLFAQAVAAVAGVTRPRNVPVIAFSTDASVAARGVYLLSFLPESDADRIIEYAVAQGKRSFVALIPANAYGTVVEAAFTQTVTRKGARIVAFSHYHLGQLQGPVGTIAQAAGSADAIFIPDGADALPSVVQALTEAGVKPRSLQLLGTGLWDDPRIFKDLNLHGAWYAAPDSSGFRNFSTRYRSRFGQDPVRTATLSYDAIALVAALAKTQGAQRFSEQVLTNPSGFAGIDGLFRFRTAGPNERGLAVLRVAPGGGQVISPPPRAFGGSGT